MDYQNSRISIATEALQRHVHSNHMCRITNSEFSEFFYVYYINMFLLPKYFLGKQISLF